MALVGFVRGVKLVKNALVSTVAPSCQIQACDITLHNRSLLDLGMERLWSKKSWQIMLVVVVTLGTNSITYTVCVYGSNYYSYQKSKYQNNISQMDEKYTLSSFKVF